MKLQHFHYQSPSVESSSLHPIFAPQIIPSLTPALPHPAAIFRHLNCRFPPPEHCKFNSEIGFRIVFENTIQQFLRMGNICAVNEADKLLIECPHRKKRPKDRQRASIQTQIDQLYVCPLCRELKDLKIKNQEARLERLSEVSLTSQDLESEMVNQSTKKLKIIKINKKTINDFEVVRGLGKGAFGKVYLIKERDYSTPLKENQDIMSLNVGNFHDEEVEVPEELTIQFKKESEDSARTPELKENRDASNILSEEYPKFKPALSKTSDKNPESGSKISTTPKYYALKILTKSDINSEHEIKQAIAQRNILESMDHPFIVKLHYAFQTKSRLFLIVDLLAGGELFYLLRKLRKFDEEMTRFYAAEILLALEYLHSKSIIYRDLKPENILLDTDGHIKITDFGLSKMMYSSNQKTYSLCGTPEYIAPQVIIGGGYTQAADWFSYVSYLAMQGSLVFDMLTGRPPFLNNNKNTMLKNLVTSPVPLPYYLSEDAKSLLNGLFKIRPEERLGYKGGASQIKKHKFFSGINWTALLQRKIKAPVNFADQLKFDSQQQYVNSNGFQKWSSWQMNMESPVAKKTKESRQHFEGFTYENCEVEFYEDQTPGQV